MTTYYRTNELTSAGVNLVNDIIQGGSADYFDTMKIGKSDISQLFVDWNETEEITDLVDEYTDYGFDAQTIRSYYDGDYLYFCAMFTNTSSETRTVREVGLFSHSDVMLFRRTVTGASTVVEPGDTIEIKIAFPLYDSGVPAPGMSELTYRTNAYYGTLGTAGGFAIDTDWVCAFDFIVTCSQVKGDKKIPSAAFERIAKIAVGNVSDSITKMQLGSGTGAESLLSTDLETPYSAVGHGFNKQSVVATYTDYAMSFAADFTNTTSGPLEVREIGLFFNSGALALRHVVGSIHDMPNLCYIPAGVTITVTVTIPYYSVMNRTVRCPIDSVYPTAAVVAESTEYLPSHQGYANITTVEFDDPVIEIDFDTDDIDGVGGISYNGVEIKNGYITHREGPAGGESFEISGHTYDYNDIIAIQKYAGETAVARSVSGLQFVTSPFRSGTLAIYNKTTHTYNKYSNAYISGEISIDPLGLGWWYYLTVICSNYEEVIV